MTSFSDRMREAREAKGWSKYHIAKATGLSEEGVAKLEREGNPRLSTLLLLSQALGVPVATLAGQEGPQPAARKGPATVAREESPEDERRGKGKPAAAGDLLAKILRLVEENLELFRINEVGRPTTQIIDNHSTIKKLILGQIKEVPKRPELSPEEHFERVMQQCGDRIVKTFFQEVTGRKTPTEGGKDRKRLRAAWEALSDAQREEHLKPHRRY
jgi:transcriptional regulator with XRE-family HTH domain